MFFTEMILKHADKDTDLWVCLYGLKADKYNAIRMQDVINAQRILDAHAVEENINFDSNMMRPIYISFPGKGLIEEMGGVADNEAPTYIACLKELCSEFEMSAYFNESEFMYELNQDFTIGSFYKQDAK
jgi:hypothetical protein